MQTTSSPGRRDPADIFSNMGRASDPATQAQAATPRAHTEVVSSQNGGTLVTDDPNTLVEAVVRPAFGQHLLGNHQMFGQPMRLILADGKAPRPFIKKRADTEFYGNGQQQDQQYAPEQTERRAHDRDQRRSTGVLSM